MTWGIIPAAGNGMRIQPLAFSKELLPVGSRTDAAGVERPRAVSEYLVERMIRGGARKLCFVISPWKSDILQYYGGSIEDVDTSYVVQNHPDGLCDAIFCAAPVIRSDEPVLVGLPDTIWFPQDAFNALPDEGMSLLLFRVDRPQLFDAVIMDDDNRVREIRVKSVDPGSSWIWGGFKMPGHVLHAIHTLWLRRDRRDEYIGTLLNAWLAEGNLIQGICAGEHYVDVGTVGGYRDALRLLGDRPPYVDSARFNRATWNQRRPAPAPRQSVSVQTQPPGSAGFGSSHAFGHRLKSKEQ
jgi:dTDP-glucose pyrophosphorylase